MKTRQEAFLLQEGNLEVHADAINETTIRLNQKAKRLFPKLESINLVFCSGGSNVTFSRKHEESFKCNTKFGSLADFFLYVCDR